MVQKVITDKMLENLNPAAGARVEVWDSYVEGFGYRASTKGRGSFFIMYRLDGRQRRMSLGRYPIMGLEEARGRAKVALAAAKANRDPVQEEDARKREEGEKRARTMQAAVDDFLLKYPRYRPSTRAEVSRLLKKEVLPTLKERPVSSVTRRDIARVVNAVADRGAAITANRVLAYLGAFFSWLVERGELEATPLVNLAKPAPERSRDRVLTDGELRAVWLAGESMAYPFGRVVQLLLLTAQRRDEVAGMRRKDVDLAQGLWTLEREATKSDRRHEVPLSPGAVELLKDLPERGDLFFAAMSIRKKGDETPRHISGWSNFKTALDKKAVEIMTKEEAELAEKERRPSREVSLPAFTLHDLRRTAASGMARLGIAPHVVERVLNHSSGTIKGVAAIYNRHDYAPEMRHALNAWAAHVEGLVVPRAQGNITNLADERAARAGG